MSLSAPTNSVPIAAALGIAVRAFLAALVTRALSDEGIVFAIAYGTLVLEPLQYE